MRGLRIYKVGIGVECVALKYKEVKAANMQDARKQGLDWLHQEVQRTGIPYDHVEVHHVRKERKLASDAL